LLPPPFEPDEPPLFDPPLFAPPLFAPPLFAPPLFAADEPPLFAADEPPPREPAELLFAAVPRDAADPPLFAALLRVDDPPLFAPPELLAPALFAPPEDDFAPPLDRDVDARALPPPDRVPPPLERDEVELVFFPPVAARAAAAPTAAPAAAPAAVASGFLRREVLRFSFSPRPALKPTVVRSGILISVPVRGLRPLRAARVRRVNFPNPGMDSDPAACTASEMAPDAVSKIASTTRAAAALVSSAFSATASMNSDLFMFRSPDRRFTRRGPSAPRSPHANSVPPRFARCDQGSAAVSRATAG
jgi:hypothetical protein